MPTIHIVRHGEARARFGVHHNPGLSQRGALQAEATAQKIKPLGPMPIYTSPLARTQETAQFLANCWDITPVVEHAFAEIPSPFDGLADRERWLSGIMARTWKQLPGELKRWRSNMIARALSMSQNCVVFSHFLAINILVGAATGCDKMVTFRPDNASITELSNDGGLLTLLKYGVESTTKVN